jgi:DNA-binding NtrC family response regulator
MTRIRTPAVEKIFSVIPQPMMNRHSPWADPGAASIPVNLIGGSPAFRELLATVRQVADFDVTVSIFGETGTGKELVARSLHYLSHRADGPFIPVNCGSVPDTLLESELFGHKKGAFTDARTNRVGLVEQAQGGTLFLDEIEALSPKGQVTLLRFLQDMQYRRVGGGRLRTADVRIVVASNIELNELRHRQGEFRDDLYYRLNVLPIRIPPLRQRTEDIPLLANHFLQRFKLQFEQPHKRFSPEAMPWLMSRSWDGNGRELENAVQRGLLLATGEEIDPNHLEPEMFVGADDVNGKLSFNEAKLRAVNTFEHDYLTSLMAVSEGNVTRAASRAGKERRALGKLLKKHGIDPAFYRQT